MPNWTSNTIRINANKDTQNEIKELMNTDESCFDFNSLIPMPGSLDMTSGSITYDAIVAYLSEGGKEFPSLHSDEGRLVRKLVCGTFSGENYALGIFERLKDKSADEIEELREMGEKYVSNYQQYGALTWYEWCNNNWGTKWNACEPWFEETDNQLTYYFDTAWSAPFPIFEELSRRFPNIKVRVEYRNEDGYECIWNRIYENGEVIEEVMEVDEEYMEEFLA